MIFEKKILDVYRGIAFTRCDGDGTAFYFGASDFEGLRAERFEFPSSLGHTLVGYFYSYDQPKEKRIVIFDHGFGGGHSSYLREIEMLCRHGYLVFAYDHTGCMESGGDNPNGMSQSLRDLDDCINALHGSGLIDGYEIFVMGHSWGGFSTLNIAALHPEVTHIAVLSGFVSVELLVGSIFSGVLKLYRRAVLALERAANTDYFGYNAVESLKNSSVKALLIYSDNDPVCTKKVQYDALCAGLSESGNVKLMLEVGKGHNPNYTSDAVAILADYAAKRGKLLKRKKPVTEEQKAEFIRSFDWRAMTEQDERVWQKIFEHFDD